MGNCGSSGNDAVDGVCIYRKSAERSLQPGLGESLMKARDSGREDRSDGGGTQRFSIISVLFVLVEALDCDVAVTCVSA